MKWGLKWMDKYANKYREWVILLGYIGVGAGFVGLVAISVILIKNLVDLFVSPEAVSGVSLVLPGVNIPGLGVLPFWYWILAIFVIATVHEFAHGIVARAHNVKVKNTGIVLFGPIIGAFVEPDEKQLMKQNDIKQYSILAAGAFSNVILAIFAILLLNLAFMPLQQGMVEPTGFTFNEYVADNLPFAKAGIQPGEVITAINGKQVNDFQGFAEELTFNRPGDTIQVTTTEGIYPITLAENPDVEGKSFLGIQQIENSFDVKEKYQTGAANFGYNLLDWINGFLKWLFILSLGIGLFNLLPLPLVDGGRMAQVFLHKLKGKKKGENWYRRIGFFFLAVLLLNLLFPLFVGMF